MLISPDCPKRRRWTAALALYAAATTAAATAATPAAPSRAGLDLRSGDTLLFYGNSMVERLLEHGELQARVHLAEPEKDLHFRSLAWTGDEVGNRQRAEGYAGHLRELLDAWPARIIVLGYGLPESFAGEAGLPAFQTALDNHLDQLQRQHPGASFVLLSPIAIEDNAERTASVRRYSETVAAAARARGAVFIDLLAASLAAYEAHADPLTTRGIHLNDAGHRALAPVVAAALAGEAATRIDPARLREVGAASSQLASYVADAVRPKNGILYYGQRKRAEERAAEMPLYFERIEKADALVRKLVRKLVRDPSATFADAPFIALTPPPPPAEGGPTGRVGTVRSPAAMQAEFAVADGFAVNLFASEEQFPELRAPVQIAFDARGRLWVVAMPSFPHTLPGQPREDALLILEDTDRDGRADSCRTYAEGFDALDGIAFTEDGPLVSEQSRHWLLPDADGDGRADSRIEVLRGVDPTDSHHGGMIATDPVGGVWFSDGVFHRSQFETPFGVHRGFDSSTYRHNLRTGRIETEWQSITPNPWRVTFDRTGNVFQMYGDGLVLDGLPLTWTPLGIYHPFAYGQTVGYGKGSAAASVSSPNFPEAYQQGMASAACIGPYAVSLTRYDFSQGMVRGHDRLDLVSSPNPAFRPVDVNFGFDGALYVSDFASAIIGHAQHPMRDPRWNHTKGRIWRIVHTGRPVVSDWPEIAGASPAALCQLLSHPQDIVRHHARIELRRHGRPALAEVDSWVARHPDDPQAVLEALFVCEGLGETRPALLESLLVSDSPLHRAAAVRLARIQADRSPGFLELLARAAADPHPRVRMEVVDAIAHLRASHPPVEQLTTVFRNEAHPDVADMLADLVHGTAPRLGNSVPVLENPEGSQLKAWTDLGGGRHRTFIDSGTAQPATLALRHSYLDVFLNDRLVLSFDSQWSSEQQTHLDLHAGLNMLEIVYRQLGGPPPPVHVFSPAGTTLTDARTADDATQLADFTLAWESHQAAQGPTLRIQAVPNQLLFSPRELHAPAGTTVRLLFENPDLMVHNLVLIAPGAEEAIGTLADQLAADPKGQARGYLPDSPKILHATPLVAPQARTELVFKTPDTPGRYPFLCTFPGHWRLMKGVLVVE